ncbi:uncharacterized protein MELLADRAFT_63203 [Melampsora larici-populina 98AG31]|uniref:C3H1-type domain-containing protein n=1 Tax=Melampsora larici-populina (strain 98AG31 / pathotype 3-4-7) TaxID=747676 RepID=F4RLT5_MELLP|nr:uncharacterized protein MELLADRAFT_63203 [Melampsora larici-populina 98AG31]EGG06595.1 hypothetical protein MELLADRAFT_63203 [Melampsora larici-populina 98AG31]
MAIDLASQIPQANDPGLDTIEQLKVQAKIQMDRTTAELDHSSQSPALDTPSIHPVDHSLNSVNVANDSQPSTSAPVLNEVLDQTKAVTDTSLCFPISFNLIDLDRQLILSRSYFVASDAPALPRSLPPPHIAKNTPCRFFAIGSCKYGDACAFSHDPSSVAQLPASLNGTNPIDSSTYPELSPSGFFRPHPAQSYEEAAVHRYYGYCDSGPMPSNNQPIFNAPIPPPNSLASATTTTGLSATDPQGFHSQSAPLPADHENYHPSGPPSFGMPYGFSPGNPPPMDYAPGTPVNAHSNAYYSFPGSIPPQGVYGPMPPHGPSGYYEAPPMGDVPFNGYPIPHPVPVVPENSSGPAPLPVPHSPQDPVYYPQQNPFPLPPSHDGLPCHPMGEYISHYLMVFKRDTDGFRPFMKTSKESNQPPLRPMEGYSPSTGPYPSHPAPHSTNNSYIAGSGPPSALTNAGRSTEPTRLGPLPRFQRNNGNFRRGHAGRGGGSRPLRPRLSPNTNGINPGPHRSQLHGPVPHTAHPCSSSSASGPIRGANSLPVTPLDERGPRGPCSFFAENRCRFGDECLWAHVMPNGDDAKEYRLNYVGPNAPSKDGVLGSEVGFGAKMIRKAECFDSRSIPGYALWEKKYKTGPASAKEKREGDEQVGRNEEIGISPNESKSSSSDSIRQKVDDIVQQRREGNFPGHQFPPHKNNRAFPAPSRPSHLKFVTAPSHRTQRVPNGEDFPALLRSKTSTPTTNEKPVGPDCKVERRSNDDETSSNSGAGGSEVSNSTNATSTKDSPGLNVRKVPVIGGASFALAAARGASINIKPTPPKSKSTPVPAKVVEVISTTSVEEGIKSLEIDSSARELSASA